MHQSHTAQQTIASANLNVAPQDVAAHLVRELDRIELRFLNDDVIEGMRDLRDTLLSVRSSVETDQWNDLAAETVLTHPITQLAQLCPVTRRSFEKLRGYPGDAPLLDLIYGIGDDLRTPHPATIAGQVHFFVVHSSACRAVRDRRQAIAREIAKTTEAAKDKVSVLSVACGHLREVELLAPAVRERIGMFHALDQDEASLAEVTAKYGAMIPVDAVNGSVRSMLRRHTVFENLDFAYSAGLFDYLVEPVGMRLVERMFEAVKPGGRVLIANFTPALEDIGYMETFMDWRLIYRTPDQVRALFDGLPKDEVASMETFEDEKGVVAYVAATKK